MHVVGRICACNAIPRFRLNEKRVPISATAADALKIATSMDLRQVILFLEVICVLPITSAETEHCFSQLKNIKTPHRSTMGDFR